MKNQELKVGTVVWLKSGSPAMTIEEIDAWSTSGSQEEGLVRCSWFVDSEKKSGKFREEALTTTEPDS